VVKSIPYLLVQDGKRAIKLYEELFGANLVSSQAFTPEMGKFMGFPDDFDYENSTMHAILDIGGGSNEIILSGYTLNLDEWYQLAITFSNNNGNYNNTNL
jgi:uncharacterized glyoxalase superfamily protein PhnB